MIYCKIFLLLLDLEFTSSAILFLKLRKELLIEQRNQLITKMADMKKTLDRLNYKIEGYEQIVISKEKELIKSED